MKHFIILFIVSFLLAGCAVGQTPEPTFSIEKQESPFEIRAYDPMIIAEVTVQGERNKAINDGFRVLADYIFGNNIAQTDIAMTAPVTQTAGKSQSIPMTAPVTHEQNDKGEWVIAFIMPPGSSMDTLPRPVNPDIRMIERKPYRAAVVRFSGLGGDTVLKEKTAALKAWMTQNNLSASGEPVYAYYNPPWTLPFMRRNEVMISISE